VTEEEEKEEEEEGVTEEEEKEEEDEEEEEEREEEEEGDDEDDPEQARPTITAVFAESYPAQIFSAPVSLLGRADGRQPSSTGGSQFASLKRAWWMK
jgi:hypothetical protein